MTRTARTLVNGMVSPSLPYLSGPAAVSFPRAPMFKRTWCPGLRAGLRGCGGAGFVRDRHPVVEPLVARRPEPVTHRVRAMVVARGLPRQPGGPMRAAI